MTATIAQLAAETGADAVKDATRLQEQLDAAEQIVGRLATGAEIPEEIMTRAQLEAAADLWRRNNSRTGVPNFDNYDGNPEPFTSLRDPHKSAYTVLRPWLTPPIG
ncbi:hypothetical protein [Glutamicibacter halophytocola]|uniref:hypothetical protein n=1 Tax=Glutamicibacter halophytocola TaxID=1933880 RepID=UPI0015C55F66|nr:hypothetical protein [Glutamicibacter halophytocola]NQD40557.1 hypothetical protein [Glutamicibacter halophytocola]